MSASLTYFNIQWANDYNHDVHVSVVGTKRTQYLDQTSAHLSNKLLMLSIGYWYEMNCSY